MKINKKRVTILMLGMLLNLVVSAQRYIPSKMTYLYLYVDKLPQFKGGPNQLKLFLKHNFHWPDGYLDVQGTVLTSFIISSDGIVKNVKVEKSLNQEVDDEAIRVISSMPKWIPGRVSNKNVDVKMYLPFDLFINE